METKKELHCLHYGSSVLLRVGCTTAQARLCTRHRGRPARTMRPFCSLWAISVFRRSIIKFKLSCSISTRVRDQEHHLQGQGKANVEQELQYASAKILD